MQRASVRSIVLATLIAAGACCTNDEEHAVTVSSSDSLTVNVAGSPRKVEFVTRLTQQDVDQVKFDFVFNTVEGSTAGDGITFTFSGRDPVTDEIVMLSVALPVPLVRGHQYPVGATFTVEPGFTIDPSTWGPHDLQQPAFAEVAFTSATYTFPPGTFTPTFRAAAASGSIVVTERSKGHIGLVLDLALTSATGEVRTVKGAAQVNSERFTPSCT